MVRRITFIVIGLALLGILFISVYPTEEKSLQEYQEQNEFDTSEMFAILLDDGNGNYIESTMNSWPSKEEYAYNSGKSGCSDLYGNKVEDVLEFYPDDNKAIVKTPKTVFCYLYFDKDKNPPTGGSVSINSNATYTTSTGVTLTLEATGATQMCISTSSTSCNASYEDFATSKNYPLATGDGTKTVYVWFRDDAGNTTSSYVSDSIILDGTAPKVTLGSNSSTTYSKTKSVTVTLSDATNGSGLASGNTVRYGWSTSTSTAPSYTTASLSYTAGTTSKSFTASGSGLTGTYYLWVYPETYEDRAGNSNTAIVKSTGRFYFDNTAPSVSASDAGDGKISVSVTENHSGVASYCVNKTSNTTTFSSSACNIYVSSTSSKSFTTSALSSSGTYYVHVKDQAGNVGHRSVTINLTSYFGEYLLENPTTGLNTSTAYNGMYRYIGTTANNYVKLGSVLYRVIGVTSTANSTLGLAKNQVKLIKATSVGGYNWHTSETSNTIWTSSAMYSYLQGSNVLSNTSVIPSGWSSKISSVKWNIGDVNGNTNTYVGNASTVLSYEEDRVTSTSSKIGLMYLSDYYYAQTAGGTTNCYNDCSNWMTGISEWTMTRYGYHSSRSLYYVWRTSDSGSVWYSGTSTNPYDLRPVFYLNASVTYVSGSGTSSNPFILS